MLARGIPWFVIGDFNEFLEENYFNGWTSKVAGIDVHKTLAKLVICEVKGTIRGATNGKVTSSLVKT